MRQALGHYEGDALTQIAFPLGGIGAGMFCLQGSGAVGQFSIRNQPAYDCEPPVFAALSVSGPKGRIARVIEGPVPRQKIFGGAVGGFGRSASAGNGLSGRTYGLPRFETNNFSARFPLATLTFHDPDIPLRVALTGFSPFIPGHEDLCSLPAAALEYSFENPGSEAVDAVFYYSMRNFLQPEPNYDPAADEEKVHVYARRQGQNGQALLQVFPYVARFAHLRAELCVAIEDEDAAANADWFRGGWFDAISMQWNDIEAGAVRTGQAPNGLGPGGSLAVPFTLAPGQRKTVTVKFAWYAPGSDLRYGPESVAPAACGTDSGCGCRDKDPDCCVPSQSHTPWYAAQFADAAGVMEYFCAQYDALRARTEVFSRTLYDQTLPPPALEALSANLSILKSPTLLRQQDGRLWAWEGCFDCEGCCTGTCTHVWNYAQAVCHLFPALERTLRQTEFNENQNAEGHQEFRAALPIRPSGNVYHAAADGQLGGIMKLYRDWRICADDAWLAGYWDRAAASLEYCIRTWDPAGQGVLTEPHHNTYDIEFWGADGMCSSFYLGALKAAVLMGEALDKPVERYAVLYRRGRAFLENELFNGEYFYQRTEWASLRAKLEIDERNPAESALLHAEGPKYQYGTGCLSDGVLGAWMAMMCGLGEILDEGKVKSHLLAVYRYNFRRSLRTHANPQRPGYALGKEGGLLLCSWPGGGKPSLPFPYSSEVWTGIEYQVATHLIALGCLDEGMAIIKACRARYSGAVRNPFNEYECGHWYARALASFAVMRAFYGVWYDAREATLYYSTQNARDFRCFLSTAGGYGTVVCEGGQVRVEVAEGAIPVKAALDTGAC